MISIIMFDGMEGETFSRVSLKYWPSFARLLFAKTNPISFLMIYFINEIELADKLIHLYCQKRFNDLRRDH